MRKATIVTGVIAAMMTAVNVSAEGYGVDLTASPKADEVRVGDRIEVTVSAVNTGDELNNFKLYFEDQEIYSDDVLEPGETAEKEIALLAWECDIDSGGVINVSADADELEEPVTAQIHVTVLPGKEPVTDENGNVISEGNPPEGSPSTGNSAPMAALAGAVLSSAVLLRKRK